MGLPSGAPEWIQSVSPGPYALSRRLREGCSSAKLRIGIDFHAISGLTSRRIVKVALITLGCLLRGDTPHFDFISAQVTNELSRVSVETRHPIAFGVITCETGVSGHFA